MCIRDSYRKKLQQLTLVATAPDINLSRMDTPSDQIESLQQDIMHRLNQMRMNVETADQKSLEEKMCIRDRYINHSVPFIRYHNYR